MGSSNVGHIDKGEYTDGRAFFTGTTALKRGQALVYDTAYTGVDHLVTDPSERRVSHIKLPAVAGAASLRIFAGVCTENSAANAAGHMVYLRRRGIADVAIGSTTTNGVGRITACAGVVGNGTFFTKSGNEGRGSAIPLQSITALASATATGPGIVSEMLTAMTTGSITYTTATKVLVAANKFTNAAVGDRILCFGGGGAATAYIEDVIAVVTDASTVTLTTGLGANATDVQFVVIRGYPTCKVLLEEGPESGLMEFAKNNQGAASPAMVGGTSYYVGGTLATNATFTLANGTRLNETKDIVMLDKATTATVVITLVGLHHSYAAAAALMIANTVLTFGTAVALNQTARLRWDALAWVLESSGAAGPVPS